MNLYLDINSRTAVTGIGVASPLPPITFKDQDTPALNIYFCLEGVVQDEGSGAAIKFGLNLPPPNPISLLVYDTVFTKQTDTNGNVYYQGFPVFYTSQLVAALGTNTSIQCVGEVRTQLSDGEIWRSMDIAFTIWRTILLETTTPPPVVVNTYPDASTLELITRKGQPNGYAELDASAHLLLSRIPSGVELTANRDVASGYPSLDTNVLLHAAEVPIDGTTLIIDATTGKITARGPSLAVVATTTQAFTVPAVAANVNIGVPTDQLIINAFYLIGNAGYYQFLNPVDPGHGTFQNTGSLNNAAVGTVVPFGQTLQMTGPPGPGGGGGIAALTDAIASPGQSLIFSSSGVLRRLIQGSNVTLDAATTPGGIIISSTGTGGGGVAALTDAETTTGFTLIYNSTGVLKRLIPTDASIAMVANAQTVGIAVALVDAETTTGVTLLGSTNGQIKRLVAGTGVTLDTATTPGGVIVNAPGGGAGVAALTDAETSAGVSVISSSTGVLKRLVAGSNITLTPDSPTVGGVTIAASGGGIGEAPTDGQIYGRKSSAWAVVPSGGGPASIHAQVILSADWTWSAGTVIPWSSANYDPTGMWASANPSRLTVATAGYYLIEAHLQVTWGVNSGNTGVFRFVLILSGTTKTISDFGSSGFGANVNDGTQNVRLMAIIQATAGQYFQVAPYSLGGTPPTNVHYVNSYFQADYLGT